MSIVTLGGVQLNQHFAVALDNQLLTVPQIDFRTYPDGIIGGGADVSGGFTHRSGRDLATELRDGVLPLALRVVR
jgi:preprotein translocase subunit SecD